MSLYPLSSVRKPGLSSEDVINPTPTRPSAMSKINILSPGAIINKWHK